MSKEKYVRGAKVLIFETKGNHEPLKNKNGEYITGTILYITLSDDLSYHGSARYEEIYAVEDENGNRYYGTHRCVTSAGELYYFYTVEDYVSVVEYKIAETKREIRHLLHENSSRLTELVKLKQLNATPIQENKIKK